MGEKKPVEDGGHEERVEAEEDECKAEEKEANRKQPAESRFKDQGFGRHR